MPNITVPQTQSAASAFNSSKVRDNIYDVATHNTTPEVRNGGMDIDNLDLSASIQRRIVRPETRVWSASAADTCDLFRLVSPPTRTDTGAFQAVPGACVRFWVPETNARVRVYAWCSVTSDSATAPAGRTRLSVDESALNYTEKLLPRTYNGATALFDLANRMYVYHYTSGALSKGWHTAAVTFWVDCELVRLRQRGIQAIIYP